MKPKYGIEDIDELMADRKKFEEFIYTPVDEAMLEIGQRRKNADLLKKVPDFLDDDLPEYLLLHHPLKAVIFRQITTPNYEIRRFVRIIKGIDGLTPFFAEYRDDKFITCNEYKLSLGMLLFNKKHNEVPDRIDIVDLIKVDGQKLSEIKTIWGQSLIEFHHQFLRDTYMKLPSNCFRDISRWLKKHGGIAKDFYKPVMFWFMYSAILFENFVPDGSKELEFTKNIFLPAFIDAYHLTGFKPLIVNLLPTSIENEKFWLSHPHNSKKYAESRIIDYANKRHK